MKHRHLKEGETWCIVNLRISNTEHERLTLEAKAREITISRLCAQTMQVMCEDNLFRAVLDE